MRPNRRPDHVLIVEPDARVRRALADLVESTRGIAVLAACATVSEAEDACSRVRPAAALVSVRLDSDDGFTAVSRLAQHAPVVAVAPVGSVAGRAIAAGATAFYDQDGDVDALIALLRDVIERRRGG